MRRLVTSVTAALVATAMTTAAAQDQVKVPERPPAAPRSAHTWRVTENFEDGKFNPPYRYRGGIPEPPGTTNTVEHTTKTRKAGKYSLECVYNQGGAAGLKILPRDYGRKDFGNDVYLRFYIKWDPDFRFYYHTKVLRWHVAGHDIYLNTNGTARNGITWTEQGGKGWWGGGETGAKYGEWFLHRTASGRKHDMTVTGATGSTKWLAEPGGGWWMVELHWNASTATCDLWLQRPDDPSPTKVISDWNMGGPVSKEGVAGGLDLNWINSTKGGSGGKLWLDEIVISDGPIGPVAASDQRKPDKRRAPAEPKSDPKTKARIIYVDNTLEADITDGTYSIGKRSRGGRDGNAYKTVQAAIKAMDPGDHIYLRGGIYQEGHINILVSKNGSSWDEGKYNKLCSYPDEWAVLDGERNCGPKGVLLGDRVYDDTHRFDLKYWWFERIEIKNARNGSGGYAAGFWGNGGPFRFRYCYIHDNMATIGSNSGGIVGLHVHDSVIERCFFKDNGMTKGNNNNPAHIALFADYIHHKTAKNGYDAENPSGRPVARNIIRHNYFVGGCVGFKHKSGQIFCGRNPAGGHGWVDTYNTYGDRIHHNIIKGAGVYAINAEQDFAQVYNNIIDSCGASILVQYQFSYQMYKALVYNNTIINPRGLAVVRYASTYFDRRDKIAEPKEHYGWDYNNLFDGAGAPDWCHRHSLSTCPNGTGRHSTIGWDLSHYHCAGNYFYRNRDTKLFRLVDKSYTLEQFLKQTVTAAPRTAYASGFDPKDPLFKGTKGADGYVTRGAHKLGGGKTIANGGVGGKHPYLKGVTIPSYVGATDPNDDGWVDVVLGLANVENLKAGDAYAKP